MPLQTLTIPYLVDNPEVGYVQARWTFANPDESYLTKVYFCSFPLPSPCTSERSWNEACEALLGLVFKHAHSTFLPSPLSLHLAISTLQCCTIDSILTWLSTPAKLLSYPYLQLMAHHEASKGLPLVWPARAISARAFQPIDAASTSYLQVQNALETPLFSPYGDPVPAFRFVTDYTTATVLS